jgi:hypothetical protein
MPLRAVHRSWGHRRAARGCRGHGNEHPTLKRTRHPDHGVARGYCARLSYDRRLQNARHMEAPRSLATTGTLEEQTAASDRRPHPGQRRRRPESAAEKCPGPPARGPGSAERGMGPAVTPPRRMASPTRLSPRVGASKDAKRVVIARHGAAGRGSAPPEVSGGAPIEAETADWRHRLLWERRPDPRSDTAPRPDGRGASAWHETRQ